MPTMMQSADLSDDMMAVLESIAERTSPMTLNERANFGEASLAAIQKSALELAQGYQHALADDRIPDEHFDDYASVAVMAVQVLGRIVATDADSISVLYELLSDEEKSEVGEAAFESLSMLGDAAIDHARGYERFTLDEHNRSIAMMVIGAAGRGRPEIYDELLAGYQKTSWRGDRSLYLVPIANTRDPRVTMLFLEALGDPAIERDDVINILMCFDTLGVPFDVHPDTGTVTVSDLGVYPDLMPGGWPPAEFADILDADDFDDDGDDDDDGPIIFTDAQASTQGAVTYDKQGVPRDPNTGEEMHFVKGIWRPAPRLAAPPSAPEIGRNAPCPCGSGKKYKYCHGKDA